MTENGKNGMKRKGSTTIEEAQKKKVKKEEETQ